MAKPRKSRRLCESVAVLSVFNILSVLTTSLRGDGDALGPSRATSGGLQALLLRQPSAGPTRSIPSCAAMPERYGQHIFEGQVRRSGRPGDQVREPVLSNRGKCR